MCCLFFAHGYADTLDRIHQREFLLWGADAEGGAPFTFPDPQDPSRLIGFEVEIASELARRLGVRHQMVQTSWSSLPQALLRGDFDIILNGLEITEERGRLILFTEPYYQFSEVLMVREATRGIGGLKDLRGRKVGTLQGALAGDILRKEPDIQIVWYEGNVEPYHDLSLGRLDAVLMDYPIARYYGEKIPGLKYTGTAMGTGYYAIGARREDQRLVQMLNHTIHSMRDDGTLKQILFRWGLEGGEGPAPVMVRAPLSTYVPLLGRAAALTLALSIFSMGLAVVLGLAICLLRLYGGWPFNKMAIAYIELFRGTPLLLQLLVIYFGLPSLGFTFPAWLAGIIGLSINFAAYEAEIYRGAISAVPQGQMEAALSLGMSRGLALRYVVLAQALRAALPASTNDFIALFKDSSLCSVIGVVELTKQFNILAVSTWRVLELGILTGVLYLLMSYPLSILARRLESQIGRQ
ncbi:MAG: ABC transporter permease subunit [Acidobacteria bacterium]|nr:ABC transporter permease subunit [Acidobacteriota bacterium]